MSLKYSWLNQSPAGPSNALQREVPCAREVRMERLSLVARILMVANLSLAPGLHLAAQCPRTGLPRHVSVAGRDDGFYRRLKLRQALCSVVRQPASSALV